MQILKRNLENSLDHVKLYVLADLHKGDKHFSQHAYNKFLKEIKDDPNAYLILNGDLMDNALPESPSDNFSATLTPDKQLDELCTDLSPIVDKILAIHTGNHELRTYKKTGLDPTKELARGLHLEQLYSADPYMLFLGFGKNLGRDNRLTVYSIYGKHGSGGGRKVGSKLNRVVDMADNTDADIYIHSHTHVPCGTKDRYYRVNYKDRCVTPYTRLYVNSSAFLDFGGYGESLGFRPASLDFPHIILNGNHKEAKLIL